MVAETIESDSNQKYERLPIQNHFIGWQCRVRQYAMRNGEGRPTSGMRPDVFLEDGEEVSSALTLLLVPAQPPREHAPFHGRPVTPSCEPSVECPGHGGQDLDRAA